MHVPVPVLQAYDILESLSGSYLPDAVFMVGIPGDEDDPTYDVVMVGSKVTLCFDPKTEVFALDIGGDDDPVIELCGHPRCAAAEAATAFFAERIEAHLFGEGLRN